jgi:hypothetical protein
VIQLQRADLAIVAIVALALAMSACEGVGGAPSSLAAASQDAAVTSTPRTSYHSPEVSGDPTTSPGVSAVAATSASPSPSSAAGSIDDPDLVLALPQGWRNVPIATYRFLVATGAEGASAPIRAASLLHLADIDAGRVRLAALGPLGMPQQAATMFVQTDTGDSSLAAAASRIKRLLRTIGPPDTEDEGLVRLPIGDAIRIVTTQGSGPNAPAGTVPSRAIQYVIRLPDGWTFWIDAVAPAAYESFVAHVDASMATLRAR